MKYKELIEWSQCTFWCSVLSDGRRHLVDGYRLDVSMHLLVLSAFRPRVADDDDVACAVGLNAPFGAQCFPTDKQDRDVFLHSTVSMHLLVLSAFRRA